MRIQTKVTLLFIALTSTVILLLSGAIFLFANHYAFEDYYKRLETRIRIAKAIHVGEEQANSYVAKALRQDYLEKLPSEKEYIIELVGGKPVKLVGDTAFPDNLLKRIMGSGEARARRGNVFFAGKLYPSRSRNFIVIVSATDPYGFQELNNLRQILTIGFLASIVVVYLVGKAFSYQTFKPIREMIRRVRSITAENLNLRLAVNNGKDEITELGQTFNNMLNRLETAFETQNNFISNASHELRTPLTLIRGEAELALHKPDLDETHQHSLQIIVKESEKLTHILSSLLGLAQSGFDGKKQHWEVIRVDELLWLVKAAVDQLYPDNHIQMDYSQLPEEEDHLKVLGNSNLLRLALSNIVVNAYKYSYNKPVRISLSTENDRVIFSVEDQGIGIPEQDIQHIFELFFRASNTTDFEGYGVGLPLSLNIIRLHRGSIAIKTKEDVGTHIRILLPIASANPTHPSADSSQMATSVYRT